MCKKDDEALRLLGEVVTDSPGGDQRSEEAQTKNDNVSNGGGHGNSKDYTLDRLAREDHTQEEIGDVLGWSRKKVADHARILRNVVPEALDIARSHQEGRGTGNVPTRTG
jgi:biotin operon repressor